MLQPSLLVALNQSYFVFVSAEDRNSFNKFLARAQGGANQSQSPRFGSQWHEGWLRVRGTPKWQYQHLVQNAAFDGHDSKPTEQTQQQKSPSWKGDLVIVQGEPEMLVVGSHNLCVRTEGNWGAPACLLGTQISLHIRRLWLGTSLGARGGLWLWDSLIWGQLALHAATQSF